MQCSSLLVGARIKNTAKAFGALRGRVFSSRDVSERAIAAKPINQTSPSNATAATSCRHFTAGDTLESLSI